MGFSLTPHTLAAALHKKGYPFSLDYAPDYRQKIAASWPKSLDDRLARSAWGWKPKYNLEDCLTDMLG
jgi:nucleoside-diphosphate-sugar epimerase